ncbi:PREDICTED: olfactory receptor 10A7-like [Nanorana parkeri]|uniref:olfactory receptor 10A7-like n=1 Tax=Nanorana parkeri TaxID=125878 RepID=UPI00085499C3|nr:PREDICTED: olfactory receptor 10A7-like [Nanorana parkeri]
MANRTHTQLTEFILVGLFPNRQPLFFVLFLTIYIFTLMGNMIIILTITLEAQLHSPMYLFLRSLSLTEIFYISVTVPRMLKDFLHLDKAVSFLDCATQLYFFCFLGTTECFLLAFMAYDRFVAICHPLHYMTVMTKSKCLEFSLGSWLSGILLSLFQISYVFSLPFCSSNIIDHVFCDILPVVRLACANTFANEIAILMYGSLVILLPFLLITVSYIHIIATIIKIPSAVGRKKTFSTCGSHLTSVTLFYGTATIVYLKTKSAREYVGTKVIALFYIVFIPMLNPLIYSLRNTIIKNAITKMLKIQ